MIIGVDFDNTIVNYAGIFHRAAVERGLVSPESPASKTAIRDALRERGDERLWTELQGHVYGVAIERAAPFDGVIDFLRHCRMQSVPVAIISHRTQRPHLGPDVDLHAAARSWISQNLIDDSGPLIDTHNAFFDITRAAKMQRIATIGCTHFIDDLPEFLLEADFPSEVRRILFDPENRHADGADGVDAFTSWTAITRSLLG